MNKIIFELQSEIVQSPEEYQSNLEKLEKQKSEKEEERNIMQAAIHEKEQSIKHTQEILNAVQKINNEIFLLKDIFKELKYIFLFLSKLLRFRNNNKNVY